MVHRKHKIKTGNKLHIASKGAVVHTHEKPKQKTKVIVKKVEVIKKVPVYVNSHTSVLTSNPTFVNHKLVTPKHMFVAADGTHESLIVIAKETKVEPKQKSPVDMKVITDYPVIINGKRESSKDMYLNAGGSTNAPTGSGSGKGNFFQKAENAINQTSNAFQQGAGIVQSVGQAANSLNPSNYTNTGSGSSAGSNTYTPPVQTTPVKKGMSTGAKVGIAVGIAAVVGLGIFLYVRHNKSKK